MAHYSFTDLRDQVLTWLHGRRFGILGDAYGSGSSLAILDAVPIGSSRSGPNAIKVVATGLAAAGSVAVAGAAVGDNVEMVLDLTGVADVSADFETTVSVAGHVQQTSANLATHQLLFFVQPQS